MKSTVMTSTVCVTVGFLAAIFVPSVGVTHPGHYDPATGVEAKPSEADRQIAFFDFELLTQLALHAPTTLQQEMIEVAYADHLLVNQAPNAPAWQELESRRTALQRRLRKQFVTIALDWTSESLRLRGEPPRIQLAADIPRQILLDVANRTDAAVELFITQANNGSTQANFTVLPDRSQLIPATMVSSAIGKQQLELKVALSDGDRPARTLQLPVQVVPAATIRGTLYDSDLGHVFPGKVYVKCSDGEFRRSGRWADNETLSRKQLLQFSPVGRYYGLPFFYSDGTFEIDVPPGRTLITLERGFEHQMASVDVDLQPGEVREIELSSGRMIDMKAKGWISGDTHVHWVTNAWNVDLPLPLLSTVQRAEDVRVANNLTLLQRGPSQAFINPAHAPMGTVQAFSDNEFHVEMGEEYRNENLYGHLCFLNLKWLVLPIGTGPVIAGDDTLDYPLNKTAILACREQGGISCEAHGLGGNKDVPVNVVHGLSDSLDQIEPEEYYRFLDCGFHLPLTNGSDHPARVMGCARAYVKVEGEFTYDKWIEGIRQCRTFTSSGPLLLLSVNGAEIGDTVEASAATPLVIEAKAISRKPIGNLQIVSNGEVLKELTTNQLEATIALTMPAAESRWIVSRCSRCDDFNAIHGPDIAHTSAIYVDVDGHPRFSADAARRWIGRMRQHIRDIRAKGQFANEQQRQEAVQYVEDGIQRYEQLISRQVDQASWPMVEQVDAQPLLVQVQRLSEALDYIGNPLSAAQKSRLEALHDESDEEAIALEVQRILDPLCLAAVDISKGTLTTVGQPGQHELVEQGWRSFLIKVRNRAGLRSRLSVESHNARSLPHAKQEDVADRWLSLAMFDGRPLQTNLSGLDLEYRIVQLYSRDVGRREAALDFSVDLKSGKPGRHIREWRFDKDADGWEALNQAEIEVKKGSLHVTGRGGDPFIGAEVGHATGELLLRFRAETDQDGIAEVFWWTEERPEPDAQRSVTVPLMPRGSHRYEVTLPVEGVLAGVRIDPNIKPSKMRFDWIDLLHARRRGETWNSVSLQFEAKASVPVTLNIADKSGEPAVAAFEIRDQWGRVYPEQTKRLAPDFFFHPQIYRMDGEIIHLPPGEYTFRMWRGPHSVPQLQQVNVGETPVSVDYRVRRWFDPTEHDWWSGDHHIHAAGCLHYVNPTQGVLPSDMLRQTMGEDLNVGCCLTWGPCFDYQKQFFTGAVDKVSRYPYLLRYDIEVSGFGSHEAGHLNLLRLQEQIYPGGESKDHWPTLGLNTLRWAKRQGAICGPAHSANGLSNYVGRMEGKEDGPNGLPHFNIPAFDGIGACEYIVDVTHEFPGPDGKPVPAIDFISTMDTDRRDEWNMWYHTLNCGYRVRASGETDFPCMSGERVGIGRVYVKVPGRLSFDDWIQGIQDGRSYVSDGKAHLVDFEARAHGTKEFLPVGENGSEIVSSHRTTIECRAKCAAVVNVEQLDDDGIETVTVELIVNGYPVAEQVIRADGSPHDIRLTAAIDKSSWLALRVFPHAHTNPFFIVVDAKPIRPSRASAEWCLRCVEQCWKEKQPTYADDEQQEAREGYEYARAAYRAILSDAVGK